jgi:hypothetical protein
MRSWPVPRQPGSKQVPRPRPRVQVRTLSSAQQACANSRLPARAPLWPGRTARALQRVAKRRTGPRPAPGLRLQQSAAWPWLLPDCLVAWLFGCPWPSWSLARSCARRRRDLCDTFFVRPVAGTCCSVGAPRCAAALRFVRACARLSCFVLRFRVCIFFFIFEATGAAATHGTCARDGEAPRPRVAAPSHNRHARASTCTHTHTHTRTHAHPCSRI